MATNAFLSNFKFDLKDTTVSPNTYSQLEEVVSGGQVGETTPTIDVSHLTSTSREYIGGLQDGDEFSLECNRVHTSPAVQEEIIALVGLNRTFRVTITDTRVSPNTAKTYEFEATILGYTVGNSVGEAARITFSFKISGGITRA